MALADSTGLVRRLSVLVESIHAVVYFAPEPQSAYAELGLRGYWRGYFASRAAPLGAAGPQLVTALFGGFARAMVTRSVPGVWAVASPQQVQAARLFGATAALRRLFNDDHLPTVAAAAALTSRCVHALPLPGRPMAAAQSGLERPHEPLAALWHDCTVLREYRGDGHRPAVAVAGLVWPEPHLLQADVIYATRDADHRALAWHAYRWDPWFLGWGLLLTAALWAAGRLGGPVPVEKRPLTMHKPGVDDGSRSSWSQNSVVPTDPSP